MSEHPNPLGVAPFDATEIAHLEEYHGACAALDALAHASARAEVFTQREWIAAMPGIAAGIAFADNCRSCERRGVGISQVITYPSAADFDGDDEEHFSASYTCPRCGDSWSTTWSVDAPLWAPA